MKRDNVKKLLRHWWKPVLIGFLSGIGKALAWLVFSLFIQ
jgi:hypothetical protein